ncbi:MAG TPA: hypothetical protein VMA95_13070 [Streptosporangiaceae bacterium]|nr:hypothetical protein [Streptosporangiaceae bacterium]
MTRPLRTVAVAALIFVFLGLIELIGRPSAQPASANARNGG